MSRASERRAAMAAVRAQRNGEPRDIAKLNTIVGAVWGKAPREGGTVLAEDFAAREQASSSSVGRAPNAGSTSTEAAGSTPASTTLTVGGPTGPDADYIFRSVPLDDGSNEPEGVKYVAVYEDPEPMKIQFQSVLLIHDAPRHDGGRGRASSETTSFDRAQMKDIVIELDTATRLVRISKGAVACYVPESGVKRFGPTLEDYAAMQAQYDAADAKSRADNEKAAREAQARAQQPAGV